MFVGFDLPFWFLTKSVSRGCMERQSVGAAAITPVLKTRVRSISLLSVEISLLVKEFGVLSAMILLNFRKLEHKRMLRQLETFLLGAPN